MNEMYMARYKDRRRDRDTEMYMARYRDSEVLKTSEHMFVSEKRRIMVANQMWR